MKKEPKSLSYIIGYVIGKLIVCLISIIMIVGFSKILFKSSEWLLFLLTAALLN